MLSWLTNRLRRERNRWSGLGPWTPVVGCLVLLVLPLRVVLFVVGLPFRIRHAIRRRAFKTGHTIDQPPFPNLTWTEEDWWKGHVKLPGWSDFRMPGEEPDPHPNRYSLTVQPTSPRDAALPSAEQAAAMHFLRREVPGMTAAVCEATFVYYNEAYAAERGFFDELKPITSPMEVRGLISLYSVHVHHQHREGMALVGLEFGCVWDEEHGFGVLMHGGKVVDIGAADAALIGPDETFEDLAM